MRLSSGLKGMFLLFPNGRQEYGMEKESRKAVQKQKTDACAPVVCKKTGEP
jgi:hypothetical protein